MKQGPVVPRDARAEAIDQLCEALLALRGNEEMRAFLLDLCTPAELEALSDRWRVVPRILDGAPYREIYAETGVSITTVGRVARFLNQGNGGYQAALKRTRASRRKKENQS